jgi:L-arabinokinase
MTTPELLEFERLLQKPNADPAGLAGFFHSGEIVVARVPARLDVMGGIADYSGANVCEGTLGRGMLMALQARTDATLRIRTMELVGPGKKSLPVETRIPLDYFNASYAEFRDVCTANPLASWAAYIAGSIFTLLREHNIQLGCGFSMLLLSAVPMNVGIGSSAAVEIGTLACLNAYLGLNIPEGQIARLGQLAENKIVGAPCGIMDQIAITSGRRGKLTHILCRPGQVMGDVEIPNGTAFVGINSMHRHSVAGNPYKDVRVGAFMGRKIINARRKAAAQLPIEHLAELTPQQFEIEHAAHLPETMLGSDFLKAHGAHDDPVTSVQHGAMYRVAGPTRHPIEENERVLAFMNALRAAAKGDTKALTIAGEKMFQAHESYKHNCRLSVDAVDFLVDAVRQRGLNAGLFGAKITGGGTGGTVAVFGTIDGLKKHIPEIAAEYARRIGIAPDIFEGTSPGAAEFGARRYIFGPEGWHSV